METPSTFLAHVLSEIGPESCDRNMFIDILQQVSAKLLLKGVESQLSFALAMMCSRGDKASSREPWNLQAFGSAALEVFPKLDINILFSFFDEARIKIADPSLAAELVQAIRAMCKVCYPC